METQPRSPEATPKNAALVAWLDRLDNVARSIQLYATEVTALCGDYDGAQGHGAVTPHVDVFFEIYSRMDEMHFMEARLAACRAALQDFRNRSTVLVPISRLPFECISRIFVLGSNPEPLDKEDPDADQFPLLCPSQKPFCLTASTICRRWRDIALSTPRVWSNIKMSDASPFKYSELMLERSRGCPLYIRLDAQRHQLHVASHLLRRYISNRHISLTVTAGAHDGEIEDVLRQLSVSMESPPRITELIMLGDPLRPGLLRDLNGPEGHEIAAPMDGIRYLYMSSTYLPRCIIPAYANLAELRLSHVDRSSTILPQLEEILRSCHQLVFLRATNVGGSDSKAPFHSRGSVKMCSLRTIEIFDAYDASVAYFLSTLVAPVLEVLRIQAKTFFYRNGQIASYIGQPLAIFLATSNPHLQNLSLDAVEILQDDLVPVLQLLPHISSLRLSRMFGAARFLETLTSERLCPQLKLLVIANMTHDRPTISVPLRTLIQPEDRLPLQRLVVQGCKHFDPPHIAWLSANAPNFRLLP